MMRLIFSFAVLAALGLAAPTPAAAASDGMPATSALPGLSLRADGDFIDERRRLFDELAAAEAPAAKERLALAEFHLARMLLPEARDYIDSITEDGLSEAARNRRKVLRTALDVLSDADVGVTALDDAVFDGWPDRPLLLSVARARARNFEVAGETLDAAVERLQAYPGPVVAEVLPDLLETAIETARWAMARELADRFGDHPALRQSPTYWYLIGRAAVAGGDSLAAFDAFVRAAEGRDASAHQARIALVRLGRDTGTLEPEEALELLQAVRWTWRDDQAASDGLMLLADLATEQGDRVLALSALSQVITDDGARDDVALAQQKARALLKIYYVEAAKGAVPLGQFLQDHRRLEREFRFTEGFAEAARYFADRVMDAGMTGVAAETYGELHDQLQLARELELWPVEPARMAELRLQQGRALMAGGRAAEAATLLDEFPAEAAAQDRRAAKTLRAEALAAAGQSDELLSSEAASDDPEIRKLRAAALFDRGDWPAARNAYRALWEDGVDGFGFADAVRLVLSAHRAGDPTMVAEIAEAFPGLTEIPGWGDIARGLLNESRQAIPLSEGQVRSGVDQAARTLETLNTIEATRTQ